LTSHGSYDFAIFDFKQPDWLAKNTDDITTQSHSYFACSREKIGQVDWPPYAHAAWTIILILSHLDVPDLIPEKSVYNFAVPMRFSPFDRCERVD
jgi:hypothetical protein